MKNFLKYSFIAVCAAVAMTVLIMVGTAMHPELNDPNAWSFGASVYNAQKTMISSGTTATTSAYTVSPFTFDYPVNNIACDIIAGMSNTTTASTVAIYGNQGSSSTLFDTVSGGATITSASIVTSTTATVMRSWYWTGRPVRTIEAVITSISTTTPWTINCSGVQ